MYRFPSTQKDHTLSQNKLQHKGRICTCIYWIVFNTLYYTALCKFSFEIQESSLSDTRSCCGDTFSWHHGIGMQKKTSNINKKIVQCTFLWQIDLSRIQSYSHLQAHRFYISSNCMVQYMNNFPHFSERIVVKDYLVTLKAIEQWTWHFWGHAQNVVPL
jgi:hypothetical protein